MDSRPVPHGEHGRHHSVISNAQGRGYFQNAGDTLRQGVELGAVYTEQWLQVYANYAFIDATFRTANVLSSPDNLTGGSFRM